MQQDQIELKREGRGPRPDAFHFHLVTELHEEFVGQIGGIEVSDYTPACPYILCTKLGRAARMSAFADPFGHH
jgi:hypothetical protein